MLFGSAAASPGKRSRRPPSATTQEEKECCICFAQTSDRTPCNHPLCGYCVGVLHNFRKLFCPLCRRDLPEPSWAEEVVLRTWVDDWEEARRVDAPEDAQRTPRSSFLATVGTKRGWRANPHRVKKSASSPALPAINTAADSTSSPALASPTQEQRNGAAASSSPARSDSMPALLPISPGGAAALGVQLQAQRSQVALSAAAGGQSVTLRAALLARRQLGSPHEQPVSLRLPISPSGPSNECSSPSSSSSCSPGAARPLAPAKNKGGDGQRKGLRIPELIKRIGKTTMQELRRFIQHISWLRSEAFVTPVEEAALLRALRRRMADVFGKLPVGSFGAAADLLLSLRERCPEAADGSDCPSKALEGRLTYLIYHPDSMDDVDEVDGEVSQILTLSRLHSAALEMERRGVIGGKPRSTVASHINRWVEQTPIAVMYDHAETVRGLVEVLPELQATLSSRLQRVALQHLDPGQLMGYALVLFDFQEHGLSLVSEQLQEKFVHQLCASTRNWPTERLCAELGPKGALRLLCQSSGQIAQAIRSTLLTRVVGGVDSIANTLKKDEDYPRVKHELVEWGLLVRHGQSAGVLSLSAEERLRIVDTLSDCTTRCMNSKNMREHVEALQDAQCSIIILTTVDTRSRIRERAT
eukprot:TRINITY_DN45271_c0_g1_i1.p1 TRINITY_DN45271_c0_g1~~TRINITY_DN45271_c0_g1_i1.p1  ORF type:complete len:643 (+),score=129.83 TRINITY_DN45271_c0_g1_i1:86-2014(+)